MEIDSDNKLSTIIGLQGVAFALLILFAPLAGKLTDAKFSYLGIEEVLAILLPFVWFASVFALMRLGKLEGRAGAILIYFALLLIALAQGMHLATNHLNDHVFKDYGVTGYPKEVGYYYDEYLSHQLWTSGYIGFMLLVSVLGRRLNSVRNVKNLTYFAGLALSSLAFAISALESQTVFLVLPAVTVIAVGIVSLAYKSKLNLLRTPLLLYFALHCTAVLLLLLGWFLNYGGFPQLTEVGLF